MSRITHQKPRPVARHHHGSAWVFFGIYLFVGLAVGAAVILLRPSGTSLSPEEMAAANAVVTEKATPPPAVAGKKG